MYNWHCRWLDFALLFAFLMTAGMPVGYAQSSPSAPKTLADFTGQMPYPALEEEFFAWAEANPREVHAGFDSLFAEYARAMQNRALPAQARRPFRWMELIAELNWESPAFDRLTAHWQEYRAMPTESMDDWLTAYSILDQLYTLDPKSDWLLDRIASLLQRQPAHRLAHRARALLLANRLYLLGVKPDPWKAPLRESLDVCAGELGDFRAEAVLGWGEFVLAWAENRPEAFGDAMLRLESAMAIVDSHDAATHSYFLAVVTRAAGSDRRRALEFAETAVHGSMPLRYFPYLAAQLASETGMLERAAVYITRITEREQGAGGRDFPEDYLLAARVHLDVGDGRKGLEDIQYAQDLCLRQDLALSLDYQFVRAYLMTKDLARAEELLRGLAIPPRGGVDHYLTGLRYEALGMLAEAANAYRQALTVWESQDQDFASNLYQSPQAVRLRLAGLENRLEAYAAALNHAQEYLRIEGDSWRGLKERAIARWHLGDVRNAESDFLLVLSRQPESAEAWQELGDVYGSLERWAEARECYERALGIAPLGAVYAGLARLELAAGNSAAAAYFAGKGTRMEPPHLECLYWAGVVADQDGRTVEAMSYWERALKLAEEQPAMQAHLRGLLHRVEDRVAEERRNSWLGGRSPVPLILAALTALAGILIFVKTKPRTRPHASSQEPRSV